MTTQFETHLLGIIDQFYHLHLDQNSPFNSYLRITKISEKNLDIFCWISGKAMHSKTSHEKMRYEKLERELYETINHFIASFNDIPTFNQDNFFLVVDVNKQSKIDVTILGAKTSRKSLANIKKHMSYMCQKLAKLPAHQGRIFEGKPSVMTAADPACAALANALIAYGPNFKKTTQFNFKQRIDEKKIEQDFLALAKDIA